MLAEDGRRQIWSRDGSFSQRQQVSVGRRLLDCARVTEASRVAIRLCHEAPDYAEAWWLLCETQLATANFFDAIESGWRVIHINPFHFEAAAALGHAYLHSEQPVSALDWLRHALKLYPDLENVRLKVAQLERKLEQS